MLKIKWEGPYKAGEKFRLLRGERMVSSKDPAGIWAMAWVAREYPEYHLTFLVRVSVIDTPKGSAAIFRGLISHIDKTVKPVPYKLFTNLILDMDIINYDSTK